MKLQEFNNRIEIFINFYGLYTKDCHISTIGGENYMYIQTNAKDWTDEMYKFAFSLKIHVSAAGYIFAMCEDIISEFETSSIFPTINNIVVKKSKKNTPSPVETNNKIVIGKKYVSYNINNSIGIMKIVDNKLEMALGNYTDMQFMSWIVRTNQLSLN